MTRHSYLIASCLFLSGSFAASAALSAAELSANPARAAYGSGVTLRMSFEPGETQGQTLRLLRSRTVGPTRTPVGYLPLGPDAATVIALPSSPSGFEQEFVVNRLPGLTGKRIVVAMVAESEGVVRTISNALVMHFLENEVVLEAPDHPAAFGFRVIRGQDGPTLHGVASKGGLAWAVGLPPGEPGASTRNTVLFSDDRGESWEGAEIDPFRTVQLSSVELSDALTGWMGGNTLGRGVVYRTIDAGTTWTSSSFPHPVRALAFAGSSDGYAVGNDGFFDEAPPISRTRDGGVSWDHQQAPSGVDLWAATALTADIALAGGRTLADRAALLRTNDGGTTWSTVALPAPGRRWILGLGHTVAAVPHIFAVGARGAMYRSDDLGATFRMVPSGTGQNLRSVHFLDDTIGWIAGDAGTLLLTTNGGETWIPYTSQLTSPVNDQILLSCVPVSPVRALVAGHQGAILEFGRLDG
jgi:photosystem II stability/assembly factor-like uncharacterized protein